MFLWYPTLFEIVPKNLLPSGLVFSVFMLSIAIGGKLFGMIGGTLVREELMAISICAVASTLLLIPTVSNRSTLLCASLKLTVYYADFVDHWFV